MGKDFSSKKPKKTPRMTKGKNKLAQKKGMGARGKQEKHAFFKKKWFKLQSPPSLGPSVHLGWMPVTKSIGTKLAKDSLMGRVAEVSLGDIQENTAFHWKKVAMKVEEVKGNTCYTSFYGLRTAREKLYTFLKKRMSLIDVVADVKSADGAILRVLVSTFTSRKQGQVKNNSFAKSSQIRAIRKRFTEYLARQAAKAGAADFASNCFNDVMSSRLLERGKKVFPLSTCLIRKIKMLKQPKIDVTALVNDSVAKKEGNKTLIAADSGQEADEAKNELLA